MYLVLETTDRVSRRVTKAGDYAEARKTAEARLENTCKSIGLPELYDTYRNHAVPIIAPDAAEGPKGAISKTVDWMNRLTGIHVTANGTAHDIYVLPAENKSFRWTANLEPLYEGDALEYAVSGPSDMKCYEIARFDITLINTGSVTWRNRTLRFVKPCSLCPRPKNGTDVFKLPEIRPGGSFTVICTMDARGGEGNFSMPFVMEENGRDCFPDDPGLIAFPVSVKFQPDHDGTGETP